ncbi:MAG: c-type cytochrome, partial [Elusimicrobiota bacterium]
MKAVKRFAPALGVVTLVAAVMYLLARDYDRRALKFLPDMFSMASYQSQESNPVFKDGKTMQMTPKGAVARDWPVLQPVKTGGKGAMALVNPVPASFEVFERGRWVFENYCMHCHGARGRGDGPVAKTFSGFSFAINGPSTYELPDAEVYRILTEGRNSMPSHAVQLASADRWKVIYYLRGLQRQEIARMDPDDFVPEDPRRLSVVSAAYGKEFFVENCASCHGNDGKTPKRGVPTLNLPSVFAMADDEFYTSIITYGRKGSQMPAWQKMLSPTQIKSLVEYLRSLAPEQMDRAAVLSQQGDPVRGNALFRGHCAGCHGVKGKGGVGNSLNNRSFLAIATDDFLRDTIIIGRKHTAMPASYDFKPGDVADLIAFIRTWSKPSHVYEDVARLLPAAAPRTGEKIFLSRCSGCHGGNGEGGIGSRLNSDSFLSMADDRFLYAAIMQGRPGSAMPAWHFLTAQDTADLIAHMRRWQRSPSALLAQSGSFAPAAEAR